MKTSLLLTTKHLMSCALLFISGLSLRAQTAPAWVKFSAPSNYANYDSREVSVGVDTSGNIYTAASLDDTLNNLDKILLVKYNSAGVQQWMKTYTSGTSSSYAVKLLVDKGGNCYVCGYGAHNNTSTLDFMVLKYDNTGAQQWTGYCDGGQNDRDYVTSACFDASGNVVVAGYFNFQGNTWDDLGIVKWTPSGTQSWSYTYNNSVNGEDRALDVTSDASGNIYVTGSSMGTAHRDFIVIKLNSSGTNQWTNRMPHVSSGEDEKGRSIITDAAGNVYVTGEQDDWVTMKLSPAGVVSWTHHYLTGDLNRDNRKKIMIGKNSDPIVSGDAFFGGGHHADLVAFRLNHTTGASLWSANSDIMGSDIFSDAVLDTNQNIYLNARIDGVNGADMGTIGLTFAGTQIWSAIYTNPAHITGRDEAYQMVMDKNKNLILAGTAETRGSGSDDAVDVVTLKYSALVTGLNDISSQPLNLGLYPNPAASFLNLDVTPEQLNNASLYIQDVNGKTWFNANRLEGSGRVDVSLLPKGVYFIRVNGPSVNASGKFVKE